MRPKICVPILIHTHTNIQLFVNVYKLTYASAVYTSAYKYGANEMLPITRHIVFLVRSWEYYATRNIVYTSDIYDTPKPVY